MKYFKRLLAIQVFLFHPEMIGAMKLSLRQTKDDNTIHWLQQTDLDVTGEHSSNGDRNLKYKNEDNIFSIENKDYSNMDKSTESQYTKETNVFHHEGMYKSSILKNGIDLFTSNLTKHCYFY